MFLLFLTLYIDCYDFAAFKLFKLVFDVYFAS